jgi:hypothetical protein
MISFFSLLKCLKALHLKMLHQAIEVGVECFIITLQLGKLVKAGAYTRLIFLTGQ